MTAHNQDNEKAGHLRQQVPAVDSIANAQEGEAVVTTIVEDSEQAQMYVPLAAPPLRTFTRQRLGSTADGTIDIYGHCAWFCWTHEDGSPTSGESVEEHGLWCCSKSVGPLVEGARREDGSPAEIGLELVQPYEHGTYPTPYRAALSRAQYVRLVTNALSDDRGDRDEIYLTIADTRTLHVALGQALDALDDVYRVRRVTR